MPCHHFYCEECLEDIKKESKITCPECGKEAVVPVAGVKSLPSNFFNHTMDKLILKYKWRDETEIKREDCGACDPIVTFCTNCALFLCDFCQESHKHSKSCSSHNLIPLSELRSNNFKTEVRICQKHNLEFDYYCETCRMLVCKQCFVNEHLDHKYDTVEKSANNYRSKLQESANVMEKVMLKRLIEAHDHINRRRNLIVQQGDKVNEEIDQYYSDLIEKLMKQKEQLKQQVSETVSQKEEALVQQLKEVEHTQAEVLSVKELSNTIAKRCCNEEALSARNQLTILMKKLVDTFKKLNIQPVESASVNVAYTNQPLQQFAKNFTTIDSLSFEIENPVESIKQGENVTLEIIARDYNGDYYRSDDSQVTQVSAQLKSSSGDVATVPVEVNSNGSYIACFEAQQVGEVQLSVFSSGRHIIGSPYKIIVEESLASVEKPDKRTAKGGGMGQLRSIAYSETDLWAVADWTKNCVEVYDSQDKLIEKFGSQGKGDGQFQYPCGVAFDSDSDLYVTDSHNHRVQKFDIFGNYLLQFGGKGSGRGQLNYPVGITTSGKRVYIADRQNRRISVFQTDGEFCYSIGEGKLSRYFDVTIVNSQLQVADWSDHCLYSFTLDGHYCGKFATNIQRI